MLNTLARTKEREAIEKLSEAFESGKEEDIKAAFQEFHESVVQVVTQDYLEAGNDKKILASRGYRQITGEEKKFYEKIIEAGKEVNYKQAYSDITKVDGGMPQTIIEDVYRDLLEEHPLLGRISFTNVQYLTRWIMNDHTAQTAVWGDINSAITKEIESSLRSIDIALYKLTAYTIIPKDMLDLGPTYLDGYIRTILKECIAKALENAIVSGNGLKCPIGLTRDIREGVEFSTSTGYPEKEAVKVTGFTPEEYGPLVAKLAKTEKGRMRKIDKVLLICNMEDYLTKVMPATTVLNGAGAYVNNLFPFPTETEISNELTTGKAVLCLPEEYFMGLGSAKEGNTEFSDEYKFLEDTRVYKIKLYGNGRPYDNTVAIVLDISELDAAYITVMNKTIPEA